MEINSSDSAILYLQLEIDSPHWKCLSVFNLDTKAILVPTAKHETSVQRSEEIWDIFRCKIRSQEKGGLLEECQPLLAVVLWVSHVLLDPISLGSFCFLGHDTESLDSAETPFAKTPFSKFSWFSGAKLGLV